MSVNESDVSIVCSHKFTVYPRNYKPKKDETNAVYIVARYEDKSTLKSFVASGYNLPLDVGFDYTLHGSWKVTEKYGKTFETAYHEVVLPNDAKGFANYMKSLRVGIGSKRAQSIYDKFGDGVWKVLEENPNELTKVSGITPKIIEKLCVKLEQTHLQRELVKFFAGRVVVSQAKTMSLIQHFGENVLNILRDNPYRMCEVDGFGFRSVDSLALHLGAKPDNNARLLYASLYTLDEAALNGHTCLPEKEFYEKLYLEVNRNFNYEVVTCEQIKKIINKTSTEIKFSSGYVYSMLRFKQERDTAVNILNLKYFREKEHDIDEWLEEYETSCNISLADKQREAVKTAFNSSVSIITGGPGTGKTTIIKAVLYIHRKLYGNYANSILLSPTGRAARRMTEATGYPAHTIHSSVLTEAGTIRNLKNEQEPEEAETNLIVIDECSMMDLYIADILFELIPIGSRVVMVGDPDQLPSVGYGNVLHELIRSNALPFTKLDVVFRQSKNSPIITNALKIKTGETNLFFTEKNVDSNGQFKLLRYSTSDIMFRKACELYLSAIKKFGADNVILLCPYRSAKRTNLSVDAFNLELQKILNPIADGELCMEKDGNITFHKGDRVMQMKNSNDICNGEIGVITRIERKPDEDDPMQWVYTAYVEFDNNGIEYSYNSTTIHNLDLAYCTTVHKSQGSEYETVIIVLSAKHENMLRRNIIYTAVTRAKENVVIMTESEGTQIDWKGKPFSENALNMAIKNDKTDLRYSLLGDRLHSIVKKHKLTVQNVTYK